MKSLPRGEEQQIHRDFPVFGIAEDIEKKEWVQSSALIALDEGTQITAFPKNFAVK